MKITKDYEGLRRIENGDYVLNGNLISDEDIEIELDDRLIVKGIIESKKNIRVNVILIVDCSIEAGEGIIAGWGIKAGCGIKAGWGIEAGEGIKAGWGIEAGCGIEAGWGIEAGEGIIAGDGIISKTYLCAGKRIFAGTSIYRTSENCDQTIRCEELRSGEICYGKLIITKKQPVFDNNAGE